MVRSDRIDLQLLPSRLAAFLRDDRQETGAAIVTGEEEVVTLSVPAHLRRAGLGMAMIIDGSVGHGRAAKPDPKLVKLIARAHRFQEKLIRSGAHLSDAARDEKLTGSYLTRVVRLSYLAPDITRAILEGRHPAISPPKSCSTTRACRSPGRSSATCSGSPQLDLRATQARLYSRRPRHRASIGQDAHDLALP
jgi:site-specific DNA recombinase